MYHVAADIVSEALALSRAIPRSLDTRITLPQTKQSSKLAMNKFESAHVCPGSQVFMWRTDRRTEGWERQSDHDPRSDCRHLSRGISADVYPMLAWCWASVADAGPTLIQQTRHIEAKSVYCWASVEDGESKFKQHFFNASCLLGLHRDFVSGISTHTTFQPVLG